MPSIPIAPIVEQDALAIPVPPVPAPANTVPSRPPVRDLREKLKQLPLVGQNASPTAAETNIPRNSEEPTQAVVACNAQVQIGPSATRRVGGNDQTRQLHSRRIMIVDDEETNILTVQAYLETTGYQWFLSTTDSRDALPMLRREKPDVLLLDINMPHVNGLEILRCLAADSEAPHLPVIVLTAATDPQIKQQALELGATDFLTKPVDPHDLIPRIRNALLLKSHLDAIANENVKLDALVRERTEDLSLSQQQLILSLAKAAEHRDNDTGNHVLRVGRYAGIIARELNWSEPETRTLELAAQLHDVGKIGIPDSILFKPGSLDPQEWELMRKHCSFGTEIIQPIAEQDLSKLRDHTQLGSQILQIRTSPMMAMAARIAQTHHEHWDGNGYPLGLAGEDIPLEGRITAVADVFDALSTERSYKKAFPRDKCFEILEEGRGSHFDPQVLSAFFSGSQQIVDVQMALMDRQTK